MRSKTSTESDRPILVGLVLSIILHGSLFLPFVENALFKDLDFPVVRETIAVPLEFELVSPPPDPTESRNLSRYLSTVSSRASDLLEREEKGELPHGEGVLPFIDTPSERKGAEGGGKSELPSLPEEASDLGEVFRRSKFLSEITPRREKSLPEENLDFRNESSARASIGGISINTTAWDFAPYLLDLKHRIKQNWIPPLAFTALGAIHGYTWVRFRIHPDGRIEGLEILESRGHESLSRSSTNAVRGAAPFRPLPRDFPEPYLEVTFGFYYLLPGDEVEFFRKE